MNASLAKKRLQEFVWYHINGDGDCNGQTLRAYARMKNLSKQDCFDLAYFYATTYCCVSAIFLLQNREQIRRSPSRFAIEHKGKLIFQSDRKYVRRRNTFQNMLEDWKQNLQGEQSRFDEETSANSGIINTTDALSIVQKWQFFGRFSAYLFVETYCDILNLRATRAVGLTYEGDSMTFAGGACYVYAKDAEAQYIQKEHKLPFTTEQFERMLRGIQQQVRANGGDDSLVKLETSLCAYEKFFKGTRYNGFYADRMLGEITEMRKEPEMSEICADVLKARKAAIAQRYLGELHGWNGIRKDLKKEYQRTNKISRCPV